MNAKNDANPMDRIRALLKDQNGILFTSDLAKSGIPTTYLSLLVKKGELQRIYRGVYSAANDTMVDEMASLQARYKRALFSHETALFLLGLTDRTPLFYSMTVPSRYNATPLKASGVKVYFVSPSLLPLGALTVQSPHGNDIKTFNLERTICDVLRNRNQVDVQLVNEALKNYVIRKDRNIDQLYDFARQFRAQRIVREYIEVLL